jgi:hypothetical protein
MFVSTGTRLHRNRRRKLWTRDDNPKTPTNVRVTGLSVVYGFCERNPASNGKDPIRSRREFFSCPIRLCLQFPIPLKSVFSGRKPDNWNGRCRSFWRNSRGVMGFTGRNTFRSARIFQKKSKYLGNGWSCGAINPRQWRTWGLPLGRIGWKRNEPAVSSADSRHRIPKRSRAPEECFNHFGKARRAPLGKSMAPPGCESDALLACPGRCGNFLA